MACELLLLRFQCSFHLLLLGHDVLFVMYLEPGVSRKPERIFHLSHFPFPSYLVQNVAIRIFLEKNTLNTLRKKKLN